MSDITATAGSLNHINAWLFDLDNTLYPRTCTLFAQVDKLITRYVMDLTGMEHNAARKLQKDHYQHHGTTLNGLMQSHGVDPEHYLAAVHDIDYTSVEADPGLVAAIRALPGRKFIFTNADEPHAHAVLDRLGASDLFEGILDVRGCGFVPKPHRTAYEIFVSRFDVAPEKSVMLDDLEKNLLVPHEMGMSTVHVVPKEEYAHTQVDNWELERADAQPHVHHVTADLSAFLGKAVG
ncbi:MAG: pyrimidine 5'-nucleotidase [Alphaproteobacteria bacterium]|nr:pyrimidine 5'-nucleotidase [Alphaproteobacteria bacterium]